MANKSGILWFVIVCYVGFVACAVLWISGCKQPFESWNCEHKQEDGVAHQPRLVKGPIRDSAWHNRYRHPIQHKTPPRIAPTASQNHQKTRCCENERGKKHRSARTFDMMRPMRISRH